MKKTKKLASLLLALVMVFAMAATAFAHNVTHSAEADKGTGSITIQNAAKGETYKLYRLFDATVSAAIGANDEAESIAYTGTIPSGLEAYFLQDANGYITANGAAYKNPDADNKEMSEGLQNALESWAKTATAVATAESDGTTLKFAGLKYGYYVVVSSQGTAITVDSTNPNVTIVDKNSTEPGGLSKKVDKDDVNIGDTVTYTVSFKTSNYDGAGTAAKKIISYTIEDTLPEFLSNVNVTSIIVDNDGKAETTNDQADVTAQFDNKKIVLEWYNEDSEAFLYDNGATVTITYTALVTDKAAIDGKGNTNEVTITWTTDDGKPDNGELTEEETIYTYAIALKKVDDKGKSLAGAKFQFPFYVKNTPDTDGAYIYAGTAAGNDLTNELTTPKEGVITIKGVKSGEYSITEVAAPDGYNKLANPVSVTATKTGETSTNTTFYLDADGNVTETVTETVVTYENKNIAATAVLVVNKAGLELPSTGGMGTTIFYVLGGVLVVGAAILLITKKRMNSEK